MQRKLALSVVSVLIVGPLAYFSSGGEWLRPALLLRLGGLPLSAWLGIVAICALVVCAWIGVAMAEGEETRAP